MMTRLLVRVILSLASVSTLAGFQAAHAQPATVRVQSTRDPVDKSYRKMIKGMERFERAHALAPTAPLRFQLLPRLPQQSQIFIDVVRPRERPRNRLHLGQQRHRPIPQLLFAGREHCPSDGSFILGHVHRLPRILGSLAFP